MSILRKVFESLQHLIHHGPSMMPYHQALIASHEDHEKRIAALESEMATMKEMRDMYEVTKQEHEAIVQGLQAPVYIAPAEPVTQAPVEATPPAVAPTEPPAEPEEPAAPVIEPAAPEAPADAEPVAAAEPDKGANLPLSPEGEAAAPDTPAPADVHPD